MSGRIAALTIAIVVALSFVGCGGSDESTGTEAAAPVTCPDPDTKPASSFDANQLIGMTVKQATEVAQQHSCTIRVTERDGNPLPATMDLKGDRIDVTVVDGKITAVSRS